MIEAYKVIPKGQSACFLIVQCVGEDNTKHMELPVSAERVKERMSGFSGNLIQNEFPELNANQREFMQTGMTQEEWDAMFGEEG